MFLHTAARGLFLSFCSQELTKQSLKLIYKSCQANLNVYNTHIPKAAKARQLEFNVLASDASETFLSFES